MLPSSKANQRTASQSQAQLDRFLVCGLGSLGQHCVAVLKDYGTKVIAIDETPPKNWEIPNLSNLLEDLHIGDCRLSDILEQAQIRQCRAVLLVTGNERVNTEAALAARSLNPRIRLLVRSDKQNLNQLLEQNLGNFAAFEPTQLFERGELAPRHCQVRIEKALNRYAISEGANLIALIAGCHLSSASKIMNHLPEILPRSLYQHQAQRLVRKLGEINVSASLVFMA